MGCYLIPKGCSVAGHELLGNGEAVVHGGVSQVGGQVLQGANAGQQTLRKITSRRR